jgi:hypothetical protein
MFKEGFLKAVSVGFMPKEWELIDSEDDSFFPGLRFLKQELLEFSAVPVPSNPDALMKARTKGIDVEPFGKWAEDVLDDWANASGMIRETYNIGKKQIELIRRKAIGETMTYQVPESKQKELLEKNLKTAEEFNKKKEKAEKAEAGEHIILEVNRSAIAFANSLIENDAVDNDADITNEDNSNLDKEFLGTHETSKSFRIIDDGTLYRKAIVVAKKIAAANDQDNVFNAASRLLKKIDGDVSFENNEYNEVWLDTLEVQNTTDKKFEELDAMQHTDGDVASVFFNNAPPELIINESLFKSSGGAVSFTGNEDDLSIVFNGSNTDLHYYPYAKD